MTPRVLDRYRAILLDMNGTFMFGEDRFSEAEDFFATYRLLGGSRLDRDAVVAAVRCCYREMSRLYVDPSKLDDFPSLAEGLQTFAAVDTLDIPLLANVFAQHERGHVPHDYAACLQRLSRSHQLGVVSNIWAKKDLWLCEFEKAGIADIWQVTIFSSDSRSMKPSHRLFRQALDTLDVPISEILFVGDSLRVDVQPAKQLGLDTAWINRGNEKHPQADYVVPSLLELETLTDAQPLLAHAAGAT